ncbi:MAG: hypothetical protein GWN87_04810, partial [Desulfuromonadales bacterium]|nr:hypothetical protein [Desulfuromonadales bacterium]
LPRGAWQPSSASDLSFGFTDANYWFRFRLQSDVRRSMLLHIGYPSFDRIDMYRTAGKETVHLAT